MTIKLLTMKTDRTIMGELEESKDGIFYIVKQPVQVVSVPPRSAGDQGGIAFAPFLEYTEEFTSGVEISKSDVLCETTPVRELLNQYNQIFGSGIQIASAVPKL